MGHDAVDVEKTAAGFIAPPTGLWQRLRPTVINAACVLLNTICTVLLVFVNKSVLSDPHFRHLQCTTAAWHFLATAGVLSLVFARSSGVSSGPWLPVSSILPVSLLCVGFVLFGNLSLALNSVPFYQMAKILTGPSVVAINYLLFRKTLTKPVLVSVLACCGGVAMTVSGIAAANLTGTSVAVMGFITTAFYQIWIGMKITKLNISAAELLFNIAPWAVVILVVFIPFLDQIPEYHLINHDALIAFLVSGVLAAGLNLSQFLIIGRTSALTFNIVSNAKNIIIISYGWWQEGKAIGVNDMLGVILALGGATVYSIQSQRSSQR
ncbi:hypothetical protein ANO11243_072000 [Dothideomycetidae sp. 11243]|nr:hypothetical protein ANO11243_072000 [fungal sp. No.11243]